MRRASGRDTDGKDSDVGSRGDQGGRRRQGGADDGKQKNEFLKRLISNLEGAIFLCLLLHPTLLFLAICTCSQGSV